MKAPILSFSELEGQGRGIIMEVTHPLLLGPFYWPITPNKSAGSVCPIKIGVSQKNECNFSHLDGVFL